MLQQGQHLRDLGAQRDQRRNNKEEESVENKEENFEDDIGKKENLEENIEVKAYFRNLMKNNPYDGAGCKTAKRKSPMPDVKDFSTPKT